MTKQWPPPLPPERCNDRTEINPKVLLWPEKTFMDWCPECQDWFPLDWHKCPNKAKKKPAPVPVKPKPSLLLVDDSLLPSNPPWPTGMNKECAHCAHCILYSSAQFACNLKPAPGGYRTPAGCRRHKPGSFKLIDPYRDKVASIDGNKKSKKES